jgi:hypothetical protein
MSGKCSKYVVEERCIQGLVGKAEVKRTLGRPRHGWENTCIYKWIVKNKMWDCIDLSGSG